MRAQECITEEQLMLIRRVARLLRTYREEPEKRGNVLGKKRQDLDCAVREMLRAMGEER